MKLFLETLKLVQEVIDVSKPVKDYFKQITISFTVVYILYTRFSEICKSIELVDPHNDLPECPEEYLEKVKQSAWLLFLLQSSPVI